jgi:xanthine dehydrogenase accessory factor
MQETLRVFRFLQAEAEAGQQAALVTVTAVEGASVRNPSAHMAVSENGAYIGSLSGGCIEAAVVAEAQRALATGLPATVRFGRGSPYLDIRLPCGGSVDLLISPPESSPPARILVETLEAREEVEFDLPMPADPPIRLLHAPPLRLVILGHGGTVEALAALSRAIGCEALAFSPDPQIVRRMAPHAHLLRSAGSPPALPIDSWTAIVCLFHDHEWETNLLAQALGRNSLYVGAMGSRITHARRCEALRTVGMEEAAIDRIRAPIGIIPSSRDPETLALSVLTEVVAAYNATNPNRLFRSFPHA